ncbi:Crp/Fnr family transcriptional regulator [Cyanobium sp. Morenito 9A2]|uniref:Crp/Fnr family transcriptional regulator n=1 Tax=Cyanobium sp. Morenito 9A2 TaxID=2823718 RepID=UPI0020CECC40|nr:Crp/Fnr family transcriptional regulator [Cyanobium sp. Morenito 9A2]MCP9848525.1 Crp/Fnr family transcriptional regulator [Cyanobium sp. Morenito 9A2]
MVATPQRDSGRTDGLREVFESSYQKRNLVHLTTGSSVPLLKNTIWLVVRGMVKLGAVSIHGDELLLGLAGPNEPFGDPLTNVEAYEAITLCDTDLLCLSGVEIEQSPHLAMALMQAISGRYRQAEALLALLGLRRVEERVRGFLELLAQEYGQPCETGLRLNLRLTHQELASALSTTRVTVTRVIGLLRDEGWLSIDAQRHLVITHLPRATSTLRY